MFEHKQIKWKNNKMYYGNKPTGISLHGMFYIKYEDDKVSEDSYNASHAKDNASKYYIAKMNKDVRPNLNVPTNGPSSLTH